MDVSTADIRIQVFSFGERPDLVAACQRLRYQVYHRDLGLDTPDMDHVAGLDREENDSVCDFAVAHIGLEGPPVGCIRMQASGSTPFYAAKEFILEGAFWERHRFVEGARFAVVSEHRNGPVPLLLLRAFQRWSRARGLGYAISVVIHPDPCRQSALALALLTFLRDRVAFATDRARPNVGYEFPLSADEAPVAPVLPATLTPMMRMLATPRSTLCSVPAYCSRFHTWNFLLVTALEGQGAP